MPQSLSRLVVHIVFSTKDRRPLLDADLLPTMHAYLAGTVRGLGCDGYRVGGVADHVHIALGLSRQVTVAHLVEAATTASSKWAKAKSANFSWQRGCGAFTLGVGDLSTLIAYIDNQAKHHQKLTFQDEYRGLLQEHGISFDEQYMWD